MIAAQAAASSSVTLQVVLAAIGAGGILAGGIIGGVFTFKAKSKEITTSDAQRMIDQYQEGRLEDRARILALEVKVSAFERRDSLAKLYIFTLLEHIHTGAPPPPPPMPEGLL